MGKLYGKLYNRYAIKSEKGLCPEGWHVPSDEEWKQLEMAAGMSEPVTNRRGWRGNIGGKLKSERTEPEPHLREMHPTMEQQITQAFQLCREVTAPENPTTKSKQKIRSGCWVKRLLFELLREAKVGFGTIESGFSVEARTWQKALAFRFAA